MNFHDRLKQVFRDVFGADGLTDESSPQTVNGWDSMGHLVLISELERAFQVTFSTTDIVEMVNVRCINEILLERGVGD